MTTRWPRFLVAILVGALLAIADTTRAADNLVFVPLTPCRVIDTREPGAGGPLVAGVPRTFFFRGPTRDYATSPNQGGNAAGCGIPDLTTDGSNEENLARLLTITIVAASPGGPGYLQAWPANQAEPVAFSVVNYSTIVAGLSIANGVVVPMCDEVAATPCTSGDIIFEANNSGAHLVVDVTGYFHAGSTRLTLSNTALGHQALLSNTTGFANTANGAFAMRNNTDGYGNTANGASALRSSNGTFNTASGAYAMIDSTYGSSNTAIGTAALHHTTSGSNVALGFRAGYNVTTAGNNICIGNEGVAAEGSTIRIGGSQNRAFVAGIRGTTTGAGDGIPVYIDSYGQLGTIISSREVKQDIAAVGAISERLLGLRPVSFRYKEQAARGDTTPQFGLIAEEVAEVFPELVVYDAQGRPETVRYHLLVPLLLNEVQRLDKAAHLVPQLLDEVQRLERRVEAAERRRDDGCAAPTPAARTRDGPGAPPPR